MIDKKSNFDPFVTIYTRALCDLSRKLGINKINVSYACLDCFVADAVVAAVVLGY